jgi:hypothetical protein
LNLCCARFATANQTEGSYAFLNERTLQFTNQQKNNSISFIAFDLMEVNTRSLYKKQNPVLPLNQD